VGSGAERFWSRENLLTLPGFELRTIQSVDSDYIGCANPAHIKTRLEVLTYRRINDSHITALEASLALLVSAAITYITTGFVVSYIADVS
jgi:hypothetical protein